MSADPNSCPGCGFVWEGVSRVDAVSGINESVTACVGIIEEAGELSMVRPDPNRWSIVEYAGHLRDVLINLREKSIVASVVDNPTGQPIYTDDRVNLGFYSLDSPEDAADELAFAAGLISKTIAALPDGFENRTLVFSPLWATQMTIGWIAAQAFHEASHHLDDVRENLRLLAAK